MAASWQMEENKLRWAAYDNVKKKSASQRSEWGTSWKSNAFELDLWNYFELEAEYI